MNQPIGVTLSWAQLRRGRLSAQTWQTAYFKLSVQNNPSIFSCRSEARTLSTQYYIQRARDLHQRCVAQSVQTEQCAEISHPEHVSCVANARVLNISFLRHRFRILCFGRIGRTLQRFIFVESQVAYIVSVPQTSDHLFCVNVYAVTLSRHPLYEPQDVTAEYHHPEPVS